MPEKLTFERMKESLAELSGDQRFALKRSLEALDEERKPEFHNERLHPKTPKPEPDRNREEAIQRLRQRARPLPPGFKFDRLEANER